MLRDTLQIVERDGRYALFDGARQVTKFHPNKSVAYGKRGWIRKQRADAARCIDRACLTCGTLFRSEGIHNRMCDRCRDNAHGLGKEMVG